VVERTDLVRARLEPTQAKVAFVTCDTDPRRNWYAPPANVPQLHGLEARVWKRIADIVTDSAGQDSSPRQRDVDALDRLSASDLHWAASVVWASLAVTDRQVPCPGGSHVIRAGGHPGNLIRALGVRHARQRIRRGSTQSDVGTVKRLPSDARRDPSPQDAVAGHSRPGIAGRGGLLRLGACVMGRSEGNQGTQSCDEHPKPRNTHITFLRA
jgi:hypothetical protein